MTAFFDRVARGRAQITAVNAVRLLDNAAGTLWSATRQLNDNEQLSSNLAARIALTAVAVDDLCEEAAQEARALMERKN